MALPTAGTAIRCRHAGMARNPAMPGSSPSKWPSTCQSSFARIGRRDMQHRIPEAEFLVEAIKDLNKGLLAQQERIERLEKKRAPRRTHR